MDDQQARDQMIERYCEIMHVAYEEAAASSGWETNTYSRVEWQYVPEANKIAMRSAVSALLAALPVPPEQGAWWCSRCDSSCSRHKPTDWDAHAVAPEQPTQASEVVVARLLRERISDLRDTSWVTVDYQVGFEAGARAALVSSPSVETVTPDREPRFESLLRLSDDAAESKFGSRPNGTAKQNPWCPSCRANNHAHEAPQGACPRCACDVRVYFQVSS